MKERETLIKAREKISDEKRWCKGAMARGLRGDILDSPIHPAACAWCAIGAIVAVGDLPVAMSMAQRAMEEIITKRLNGWLPLDSYNDRASTKHADILSLFDEAIAACPD